MQLNTVSLAAAACPHAAPLALANLVPLLRSGTPAAERQAQYLERSQEKQRRRASDYQTALAAAESSPRPSESIARAEREMRPGSAAARDAQVRTTMEERAAVQQRADRLAAGRTTSSGEPARVAAPRAAMTATSTAVELPSGMPAAGGQRPSGPEKPVSGSLVGTMGFSPVRGGHTAAVSLATSPAQPTPTASSGRPDKGPELAAGTAKPPLRSGAAVNATGQQKSPIGRTAGFMAAAAEPAPRTRISAPPRAAAAGDPAATEAERNPDANTERILRLVHTRIGQERSVATLRLDPPELGTVRLHIDLRGEQLGLLIETQTPAARRVLEDELETLRRGLAASGIQLERVALRTAPPEQAVPDTRGQNLPSGDHGGQTGSDWHPADRSTPAQPEAGVANDTSSVPVSMTAGAPGSAAESLVDILA